MRFDGSFINQSETTRNLRGTDDRTVGVHDCRGVRRFSLGAERDLQRNQFWGAPRGQTRAQNAHLGERSARLDCVATANEARIYTERK
jgi:hypothetical protein